MSGTDLGLSPCIARVCHLPDAERVPATIDAWKMVFPHPEHCQDVGAVAARICREQPGEHMEQVAGRIVTGVEQHVTRSPLTDVGAQGCLAFCAGVVREGSLETGAYILTTEVDRVLGDLLPQAAWSAATRARAQALAPAIAECGSGWHVMRETWQVLGLLDDAQISDTDSNLDQRQVARWDITHLRTHAERVLPLLCRQTDVWLPAADRISRCHARVPHDPLGEGALREMDGDGNRAALEYAIRYADPDRLWDTLVEQRDIRGRHVWRAFSQALRERPELATQDHLDALAGAMVGSARPLEHQDSPYHLWDRLLYQVAAHGRRDQEFERVAYDVVRTGPRAEGDDYCHGCYLPLRAQALADRPEWAPLYARRRWYLPLMEGRASPDTYADHLSWGDLETLPAVALALRADWPVEDRTIRAALRRTWQCWDMQAREWQRAAHTRQALTWIRQYSPSADDALMEAIAEGGQGRAPSDARALFLEALLTDPRGGA